MKLKKLKIGAFRGIENVEYNFNDKLNVFSGKNGVGKSTIIDSIMWVLCDETLVYGKQTPDNRDSNDLRKQIEVSLEFDNGLELKREYQDIWCEDKDGIVKYSRTENRFFVNGASYKKEEFFSYIKYEILKLDANLKLPKEFNLLRSLIDCNYFGSIDYKIARKFTESLLQIKSDDEILSNECFASIKTDMQVLKFDISKCLSKYDNEYKKVENLIADRTLTLKAYEKEFDEEAIEKYNSLVAERNELFNENLQNNGEYLRLNQLLEENKASVFEEEKAVVEQINETKNTINSLMKDGNTCDMNHREFIYRKDDLERQINFKQNVIENTNAEIEILRNKVFKEIVCEQCGAIFNENERKSFYEEIDEKVNHRLGQIDELKKDITKLEKEVEKVDADIDENTNKKIKCYEKYKDLHSKLEELQLQQKENAKVNELLSEREKINNDIAQFVNEFNTKRAEKLQELASQIDKLLVHLMLPEKITNLKLEIKQLKESRAVLELQKDLVKKFKTEKLKMIKENTSKVFPQLEFEILEENENTNTFKEVCYAKLKGIEYKGINDGHRKLVGIIIIEDIKKALGIEGLPIIFDKFADIDTSMLEKIKKETNEQIISTSVSDVETIMLMKEFTLEGEK